MPVWIYDRGPSGAPQSPIGSGNMFVGTTPAAYTASVQAQVQANTDFFIVFDNAIGDLTPPVAGFGSLGEPSAGALARRSELVGPLAQWAVHLPAPFPRAVVWEWLNDPQTFIRRQPWPYFVEFFEGGFETGVLNTHTGPGIHFPGVLGEIREPEYRDLVYLYGAYVFSMRWIRPTRP